MTQTQRPNKDRLRVVLLNQAFHPDVVATAQMAKDLADELVLAGFDVSSIASRSIYGKAGATLSSFERVKVMNGGQEAGCIEVHRVGLSFFGRASTILRVLDFGIFYLLAAFQLLTIRKPTVVIGFSTPPYIALLTVLSRWIRGSKAIYWAMDLYPDVIISSGMIPKTGAITGILDWLHRWLVSHVDATVVLGRCMMDKVVGKAAKKAVSRITFIPVWSDEAGIRPTDRSTNSLRAQWGVGEAFTVMYSGNFGLGHDVDTLLGAMASVQPRAGVAADSIRFIFVGGGKRRPEVERFIAAQKLTNATYHDYQPRERLGESLCVGDIHVISLLEGMEGLIVPSKCFGIMAAGRPAIFIGNPSSEIARVLVENDCGVVVKQGDSAGLVQAIEALASDPQRCREMGVRARRAFEDHYSKSKACARWAGLIESVCNKNRPVEGRAKTASD